MFIPSVNDDDNDEFVLLLSDGSIDKSINTSIASNTWGKYSLTNTLVVVSNSILILLLISVHDISLYYFQY